MDSGTSAPWRRRTLAATGVIGIAVAGGGLLLPGFSAAATTPTTHFTWTQAETAANDQWTVPAGVCFIDWTVQGGSGGAAGGTLGGFGGKVTQRVPVASDGTAKFTIHVGAAGQGGAGGASAGEAAGAGFAGGTAGTSGGGGGGASAVWYGADSTAVPDLVAGGGGGAGTGSAGGNAGAPGDDVTAPALAGGLAGPSTPGNTYGADATGNAGAGGGGGGYFAGGAGTTDGSTTGSGGGGGANSIETPGTAGPADVNTTLTSAGDGTVAADVIGCMPGAPTLDPATAGTNTGDVTLTFTPASTPTTNVTSWELSKDGGSTWAAQPATASGAKEQMSLTGLTAGTYHFQVRGVSDYGVTGQASTSQSFTVAAPATPAAPTIDSATSSRNGAIDLSFTPNNNGVTVTDHEVSTDATSSTDPNATWTTLTTTSGSGSMLLATVSGLTPGNQYTLWVRAKTATNDAPAAQSNSVTVAHLPDAPTLDVPTSPNPGEVDLAFTPGNDNGVPATGWQVSTDDGQTWGTTQPATDGTGGKKQIVLSNQPEGATLLVSVRAVSANGTSPASSPSQSVLVTSTPPSTPVPAAPTLDAPTSPHPGEVDLAFTPGNNNGATETGWQVSTDGGQHWGTTQPATDGTGGKKQIVLSNQPEGATLQVSVRADSANGTGAASAAQPVTVTSTPSSTPPVTPPGPTPVPGGGGTQPSPSTPGAPKGVSAQAKTAQVAVSWTAPASGGAVDHYLVTLSPGGQTCTTTGLSCSIGASAGVDYTATVVAVAADGTTGPGASASVPGTVTSPDVPAQVPSTDQALTTDKGVISSATPGQKITVKGSGYLPYSTVTVIIYSTPTVLGSVVTDAAGNFTLAVTVPADLAPGDHHLVSSGVASDGTQRFMRMDITLASASNQLAWTGFSALPWVGAGVGLVAVGTAGLILARRRRGAAI
ncbi:MAG: fibronectin type protein [Frankiales bacterium]|nr:fibronectin type protein [Frankiales bacterium]